MFVKKFLIIAVVLSSLGYLFHAQILTGVGSWLVYDTTPERGDAAVVLATGAEYYERLLHAAYLYRSMVVDSIVINGNRKTEVLRQIEADGYQGCCPWNEEALRILELYGVPRQSVVSISAENAYDTISEAQVVGQALKQTTMTRLIITTSKFHTRRAGYIWKTMYPERFTIYTSAAEGDPFDPASWWRQGRQIRWLMAEYGAWFFYWYNRLMDAAYRIVRHEPATA
jgi:uncharacterized SAM-binding protein YcdF (DUF218 family)